MGTLLHHIQGNQSEAIADVIFIHGLNGDAFTTWGATNPEGKTNDHYWPRWLAEDVPDICVWSLQYDVASTAWRGTAMPLQDRAANILGLFETHAIGNRPFVTVAHSMGGLIVKQLLRTARDMMIPGQTELVARLKGILFLSTPHTGSSVASTADYFGGLLPLLRTNVTLEDLRRNEPELRNLNQWFRNNYDDFDLKIEVLYETKNTKGLRVVDETSADPGIPRVPVIAVDEDHLTITQPVSREAYVYRRTVNFVRERIGAIRREEASPQNPR